MSNDTKKRAITTLGIDLAKSSFQVHGINSEGACVVAKSMNKNRLKALLVNLPV